MKTSVFSEVETHISQHKIQEMSLCFIDQIFGIAVGDTTQVLHSYNALVGPTSGSISDGSSRRIDRAPFLILSAHICCLNAI